jgi:hemophore-related protein
MIGTAGATLSLFAGSGIASAEPNVEAIVNSTCTYPQVIAALNAQDPAAASQLTSNPIAVGWLQSFVASPPDGRRQMAKQIQGAPELEQYTVLINSVAGSCKNY